MSGSVFQQMNDAAQPVVRVNPNIEIFYSYGMDGGSQASTPPRDTLFYRIGSTLPQAIFLPNLAIIVAITCAMALSKALRAVEV